MISFALSEDQRAMVAMLERLAAELRPVARGLDRQASIQPAVLGTLWATGLVDLVIEDQPAPDARVTSWIALEELARADASLAVALAAPLGYAQAIMRLGSAAQREALRTAWASGAYRCGAVLIQEPHFGFDPTRLRTVATAVGDGFRIDGLKSCVPLAAHCSAFLIVAETASGPQAFQVPADAPGVSISEAEGSMGLRSLALTEVTLAEVHVPATARLGDGDVDAGQLIDAARVASAAILTGISAAVLAHLTPYLQARIAHGSALARKQSVAFRLADMAIEVPAMRWMGWRAASALDKGRDARREARQAQLYCAEQALWITDEGVQLMGGHGYMRDNPVERWFRDARTLSAVEGMVGL